MRHEPAALLLFRPVDQAELDLIAATDWLAFPPGGPGQWVFYPVLQEEYGTQPACDWSGPDSGVGYVVRCAVDADYAAQFPGQTVGHAHHEELWVPAAELTEFNRNILGRIEVVAIVPAG
ncbi:hypothetical protein [Hymenobacter algoricola]|uniref:ADP-ribosylation/crystallin J1 n=1 Tax=Hymenobacter algoricola TaxID=486267 RepID=A0ABP7NRN8_9BACT